MYLKSLCRASAFARTNFIVCIVICSRMGIHIYTPIILRAKHDSPAAFGTSFDVTDIIKYYIHRDRYCAMSEKKKRKRV